MKTWFVPYMKKHWRGFVLSVSCSIAALICAAGLLFTSGYLISKAALRPENILMIYVPIVGVRAFGIFRAVFQYAGRLASHDTILRILSEMRIRLYRLLEPSALFIQSRYRSGDILGILSDDIEHLQDIYLRTVLPGVSALVIYAIWIGLIGDLDAGFAFLMGLYLLMLLVVFPVLSLLLAGRAEQRLSEGRHLLYEKLTDAVLGAGDWMMSGREKTFLVQHEEREEAVRAIERRLHRASRWRDFLSQLIIGACVLSLIYWSGGNAIHGQMDRTLIAAFVLVIFTIAESLIPVSEAVEKLPQYQKVFQRLRGIEGSPASEDQDRRFDALPETAERLGGASDMFPEKISEKVEIRAEHLFFKYAAREDWAVRDVSLHIRQGEKVALIGRSGAGKSTLIHLIYGALVPERGSVTLNGTPPDTFGNRITERISVLSQNPHLFDTSVLNNLALGNEQASEAEIIRAATLVGLHERIKRLPHGYWTQMHEAGDIFSGGERERLALARILLRNAPVVILDEPTVGLDPITEKDLLRTIFDTLEEKTLIWITHHLIGANEMDRMVFLENGTIEMQGRHEQLLQTNERYRRLYRLDVPEKLKRPLQLAGK
ncbi:thiol reductant ABC exporter subunit CydC [Sporolactobacillus sp. THM7-7]|nr:thiol reductant ABC exporter subunit CydC [Sporolactobacillus sp. THM7-7]